MSTASSLVFVNDLITCCSRCERVSKRWLSAIRDDPSLWNKLILVLSRECETGPAVKGMLRVINRAKNANTLSIAPVSFDAGQYGSIFKHMKNLRHLHLELTIPVVKSGSLSKVPQQLTKLTWFTTSPVGSLWLSEFLKGSASTLEELQVGGPAVETFKRGFTVLPKLKVLRLSAGVARAFAGNEVDVVCISYPSVERWPIYTNAGAGLAKLSHTEPRATLFRWQLAPV